VHTYNCTKGHKPLEPLHILRHMRIHMHSDLHKHIHTHTLYIYIYTYINTYIRHITGTRCAERKRQKRSIVYLNWLVLFY